MKTTLEEKLRLAKLHLNEGVPIFEIEKEYGLDHSKWHIYDKMAYKIRMKMTKWHLHIEHTCQI